MSTETTSTLRWQTIGAPEQSLAAFDPPRRAGRTRTALMVTAAGLLVGGAVLAVSPPSWVQAALGSAPPVSGPDWATHTQTQLTSVDEQLSLIAQTRRNWQSVPAPLRAQPPAALTRLEQRAAALEKDHDTLARALAAYRDTSRVDLAAAQSSKVTDSTPAQTMTAVDEVERFIAHPPAQTATDAPQLGPTAPASADVVPPAEAAPSPTLPPPPAVTSVPAAPSPSWAGTSTPNPGPAFGPTMTPAAPAPPVGVRPQSPSRGSSSYVEGRRATPRPTKPPLPRAARPGVGGSGDVAPAHTSGQNPVHSTGPSRPSSPTSPTVRQPSGNASTEQGQGPYVVYLPPTPPQQQVQPPAEQPRVSPQPAPAPTALPPSQSTTGPRTGARAPISESEVEQATGDSEIARESQTPAGREILRQLFGGADQ